MPIPYETFIPGVLIIGLFGVSGGALSSLSWYNNGGKPHRYAIGQWDRQMMQRDRRLTGYLRGQTDRVEAPSGFEISNPWKVEYLTR